MSAYKSEFLNILNDRGFINGISKPQLLDELAADGPMTGYIGFDCTAPSLHVGSLLPLMMLHWMQQTGHKPIALMGGGTTRVGDPSGKDESRKILTDADIAANLAGIRTVFGKFLTFGGGKTDALMMNNNDWLAPLNYIDFLRDVGKHFSVNRMLSFDSVKLRLDREYELSFLEFNYMILQAYDFVELHKRTGCVLQMGGSDQWGNILNGIDLGHRMLQKQLFALTSHLLTTAAGAKMGKTASGAIWLNSDRTSVYEFWQFWRNTDDRDVSKFLKLFTKVPLPQIEEIIRSGINDAKRILASEVTEFVHGPEAAQSAERAARRAFEEGAISDDLPFITISIERIESGYGILEANTALQFTRSNGEARKLVESGAITLAGKKITDFHYKISLGDFDNQGRSLLERGKVKKEVIKLLR